MYIQEIQLFSYRNYTRCQLEFSKGLNLCIGKNAQGKTNLIEAIYVLAFGKSYRTSKDKELIQWDEPFAKVIGEIIRQKKNYTHEMIFFSKGKKAKIDLIEQEKLSQYIGNFNVVMFAPEDLNLVKGSPQIRRRFLDMELGQISKAYLYHLSDYQKLLQQRNALLKKGLMQHLESDLLLLNVLTEQFIQKCVELTCFRFRFIEKLNQISEGIHGAMTKNQETIQLHYIPSVKVLEIENKSKIKEDYTNFFSQIKEKEIRRGLSLFGIHRDDFSILVNGKDVQSFGSQGQQRTASLSIKLAELEFIYQESGEYPVLLLDDVLSELDEHRQRDLLHMVKNKVQTFVTATTLGGIEEQIKENAKVFWVDHAVVTNEKL